MRELVKSSLSFACAMPLLGARQLGHWLAPTAERQRMAASGLDAVARAATHGIEQQGFLGWLYQAGSCAEAAMVQVVPTLLTPQLLSPAAWADVAAAVAARSAVAARQLAAGQGPLAMELLRSKAEVFCLVLDVSKLIGVPDAPPFPLAELLAKAYALGDFKALWAVEGLGKAYGDSFWAQGVTPDAILRDARTGGLPARSLTMLDAGIGLSFAKYLLTGAGTRTPEPELRARVREIVRLCRANARPGYVGAALESLGLVTRTFHAQRVAAVDQILRQTAPEVLGYFWHGVGRAIFFDPVNFLPGSDGLVFEMAASEGPDEAAKLNAVAGAAWAYVLVAQRNPRILAELVIEPHGERLAESGAFANGLQSSTMMRQDTTPGAPFIAAFLAYRPSPANPRLVRLWDQLVRIPGEAALHVYYPVIRDHDRLGDIFEYRDLPAFVARLGGRAAA
ncbi:MAG TPA: hypothetical protein VMW75_18490 [Thermoanaerobaculia bacterium]|nr:hypothetical protein [Thermoanaerobaculia bacterium]